MLKQTLIAGAVLATAFGAQAQSAGFGITGTVVPGACTLTFGGGGLAAYGTLSQGFVKAGGVEGADGQQSYRLADKQVTMNVSCPAPIKLALSFVDNRAANRFDNNQDAAGAQRYGIANSAVPGQRLGFYGFAFSSGGALLTKDGGVTLADWLVAPTGTTTWTSASAFSGSRFAPGYTYGPIQLAGSTTPDSVTSIQGTVEFRTHLSKAIIDAQTSNIVMDGSGTATLIYL